MFLWQTAEGIPVGVAGAGEGTRFHAAGPMGTGRSADAFHVAVGKIAAAFLKFSIFLLRFV